MSFWTTLKSEVDTDPLTRGYTGMTDTQVAADLNTAYRTRNVNTLEAHEVFNEIDKGEWDALPAGKKSEIWDIMHMGSVNPFGNEASIFVDIFGGGSTTISNLAAARKPSITRAAELGLGVVKAGHVAIVRS